jgi:peptide deformylase
MMTRKIVTYPNPILRQKAKPVKSVDAEIKALVADMVEIMYANDGVGLAAPQVGVGLRVIVVDVGKEDGPGLMKLINPEILSREGEIEWEEGCLSVPDFRVKIMRAAKISVSYLDEDGDKKSIICEGLPAIAVQHEVDHLDGNLIIDYTSRLKREVYTRKAEKRKKESMSF